MVSNDTLKWASLVIFTMQNAAFVLLMRASKVLTPTHYNSAVAVLVTEVLKLPFSCLLLVYEKMSLSGAAGQLYSDICGQFWDTMKISIPALLYTVQNNALFIAVGNLEAAVFQVTYQLKTLTTAVLTVTMLGRSLKPHQWVSMLLLTGGAALVQEPKKSSPAIRADGSSGASQLVIGISATVVACVCSSVASVYLEKILVESKPSVWVRNVQLCIFTIPIAAVGCLMVEDKYIKEEGTPLHGFNAIVWAAILTNAAGGMLVATVMKYAGNILRNFAQACAIIVGGLGSWFLFGFQITSPFVIGVALVIGSIFLYGANPEQLNAWMSSIFASVGLAPRKPAYEMLAQAEPSTAEEAQPPEVIPAVQASPSAARRH